MSRTKAVSRQITVTILIGLMGLILISVVIMQNKSPFVHHQNLIIIGHEAPKKLNYLRNIVMDDTGTKKYPYQEAQSVSDQTKIVEHSNHEDSSHPHIPVEVAHSIAPSQSQSSAVLLTRRSPIKNSPIIEKLLSADAVSVSADVRGNLGPPSVVINESVSDWLRDRWQAASSMQGRPILGEHYLLLTLRNHAVITRCLIDWETGYSDHYTISGGNSSTGPFNTLVESKDRRVISVTYQHIIHELWVKSNSPVQFVKLTIKRPSTEWGASVWRFQVHGYYI